MRGLSWSWGAFGASLALHGVALASALAHPAVPGGPDDVAAVSVDLVLDREAVEAPAPEAPPDPTPATVAPAPHGHTHPYPVPPDHDLVPHDPSLVHVLPVPAAAAAPVAQPDVVAAHDDAMTHFTIDLGSSTASTAPSATGGAGGAPGGHGVGGATGRAGALDGIESEQTVSVPARCISNVDPLYPDEARTEGLEADVLLEIVVATNGTVESGRPLTRVGHGFEAAALRALPTYRFSPAMRDGHPVRVRMHWPVQFHFRSH